MTGVEQKIVQQDEAEMRLDRWFKIHYSGLAFGALQKLLRSGQIRVDGKRAKSDNRLKVGQIVRIPPLNIDIKNNPSLTKNLLKQYDDNSALQKMLLYEDKNMYILNKPAGLSVQGGSGVTRHIDGMLESWRNKKGEKPRLVHRIDKDTSGLLIVAKSRLAAQTLTDAFKKREVKKTYWAIVRDIPAKRTGRISNWLCKKSGSQGDYMTVCEHGDPDAQHAITCYKVIDHIPKSISWMELEPLTGRTHQLRIHTANMGNPIIGDPKYFHADSNWICPGGIQNKLHLHARKLFFANIFGKKLEIIAPLPAHMQQTFNLFGFDENIDEDKNI
ncbi:RluA family pseudouridine synthase [Bartonella sp. DGB1]|uniref:RluA family pseudouridine synthase n=1 Tax=Bartonella sp. DGB1 TaxID=3239807 RepID=UPI0035263C81